MVAERLRLCELTNAGRKVARPLMADYPVGGPEPVAKLAAAAGVSPPTVIRRHGGRHRGPAGRRDGGPR